MIIFSILMGSDLEIQVHPHCKLPVGNGLNQFEVLVERLGDRRFSKKKTDILGETYLNIWQCDISSSTCIVPSHLKDGWKG